MSTRPALALALLLALAPAFHAQRASENRELASLVEEQALLQRQVQRLRGTMELLLDRMEKGSHTADLLANALKQLDERSGDESQAPLTVEERMDAARSSLDEGKLAQSLEQQERLVAELERLLATLMDRESMNALEQRLERLRAFGANLDALADDEKKLRESTRELREQASNAAQKELERRLDALAQGQRGVLERTEELGRSSGAAELEQLTRELEQLVQDQRTDADVLAGYDPSDLGRLEQARAPLGEAQREEARAARLAQAAEEIRRAAGQVGAGEEADLEAAKKELGEAAERAATHARASRDPAAESSADALRRAAEELARAAQAGADRPASAAALEEQARTLDEEAARARKEAEAHRAAAQDALASGERAGAPATQEAREQLAAASEAAAQGALDEERRATERANEALERSRTEQQQLAEALSASQASSAERAERLERNLSTLEEGKSPTGQEAGQAMQEAAQDMRTSSERMRNGDHQEAARAAREALAALERSRAALGRSQEARGPEQTSAFQELAQAEAELERELDGLQDLPARSSLEEQARTEVERALDQARQAMEQTKGELSEGRPSSAARSEREALEALRSARARAGTGVRPTSKEDLARAEELAQEQDRIRQEMLDLAKRIEEQERELDASNLARAESAAGEAKGGLERGDVSKAEEKEQEAERELRRQQEQLQKEEERYQRLRAEELLFRLGEEIQGMLEKHRAQMQGVAEIHTERTADAEPSRSVKLRLRGIAREEEALATRAGEMSAAIEKEGARVSAQMLANASSDLTRIGGLLSEAGDYQTGERTQGLQRDVEGAFEWILESLQAEQARRERQRQSGQQDQNQGPEPGQRPEPLVPDSAELKLLRRMELDVQGAVDQMLALHPELRGKPEDLDPEVLRDIARLAGRHETITQLFQDMRRRLRIDAPAPETSPKPEDAPDGGTPEEGGRR